VRLLTSPRLSSELARHFELMAPFVEFMNRAIVQKRKPQKLMFAAF